MEKTEDIRHTEGMKERYQKRKETIERIFADAKEKHGMRYRFDTRILCRFIKINNAVHNAVIRDRRAVQGEDGAEPLIRLYESKENGSLEMAYKVEREIPLFLRHRSFVWHHRELSILYQLTGYCWYLISCIHDIIYPIFPVPF